jgi:hypothetical protein
MTEYVGRINGRWVTAEEWNEDMERRRQWAEACERLYPRSW